MGKRSEDDRWDAVQNRAQGKARHLLTWSAVYDINTWLFIYGRMTASPPSITSTQIYIRLIFLYYYLVYILNFVHLNKKKVFNSCLYFENLHFIVLL